MMNPSKYIVVAKTEQISYCMCLQNTVDESVSTLLSPFFGDILQYALP